MKLENPAKDLSMGLGPAMPVRSLLSRLRRFARLRPATRLLAVEAALTLLLARLVTQFVPARRWLRLLDTAAQPASRGGARGPHIPRKVGRIVGKVVRHLPFRASCLPQAMAAQWMLRRRGVPSVLLFGARRSRDREGSLQYHAWLVAGGECVIGRNEIESYAAFPAFTVAARNR